MAPERKQIVVLVVVVIAGLAALTVPTAAQVEKRKLPAELTSCINADVPDQYTTYQDFAGKVPVRWVDTRC